MKHRKNNASHVFPLPHFLHYTYLTPSTVPKSPSPPPPHHPMSPSHLHASPPSARSLQTRIRTRVSHRLSDENPTDRQGFPDYSIAPALAHTAESGQLTDRSSMDAHHQMFPDDIVVTGNRSTARTISSSHKQNPSKRTSTPRQHSSASNPAKSPKSPNSPNQPNSHHSFNSQKLVPLEKWMTPTLVSNGYLVTTLINEGNFGTVLKANRLSDHVWVAVKIVKKSRLSEKETAAIRKHAITLRTLNHRYIVQFSDDFEDSQYFYHVFEFLNGGDLYDRLQSRGKPFSEAQVLFLARQLFYALAYLHSKRAAHRDIKLENLVFETVPTDQRQVMKLIDFDLLVVRSRQSPTLETCSDMCGTILYVSPEIASARQHVPEQSDMWACGVMLYVLLSYHMPFQGSAPRQILRAVRTQEPHFAPAVWSHVSPQTKQLVRDLLNKNSSERPTAEQALERVKNIQASSRHIQSGGRLRAITRGLRSVSLNLWDPSGNLVRRSRMENSKKQRQSSSATRRARSNMAPMEDDSSAASASSSMRSSFILHSQVGSDINSDADCSPSPSSHLQPLQQKYEAQRTASQNADRAVAVPFKQPQFELNDFLTSPALGGVLARKRPPNNNHRTKPDISNVTSDSEAVLRSSRRFRKGSFSSKIRSWIHFGSSNDSSRHAA